MLENANASTYNGYWQVDGGQPVLMTDNSTDYPHKEFDVDLSSWTWKGNGPYSLTFTAKDKQSSQVLDTKSFNIYVVK